jgi:hypothetical protein
MEENNDRRQPGRGWFYLLLGLAIFTLLSVGIFLALTAMVRQTAQEALNPITQANHGIETRMAEVLNPTPTILPDPITIIHDIRSLARLETIQYTMEKVITAETGQNDLGFLFGDKLLFVGHGVVIAGVDMSRMRPQDMWIEGEVLYVRMPQAEVFVATLDNEKSYVYDRETGLLSKGDNNLETNARVAAEKEILKAALDDGILTQAQQNAESYMERMFRGLGYAEVIFVPAEGTPAPSVTP